MSISEAFDGVIPDRPISPAPARRRPSPRPRPDTDRAGHLHAVTDTPAPAPARTRTDRAQMVRRAVRVVYLDGRDSWIAEERSPSAKTVWRTRYASPDSHPAFRTWDHCWRPAAVCWALLCDAVKFLLVNPVLGPAVVVAAVIYLLTR